MSELYGTIGKKTYSNLLSDPNGAEVIAIPCTPGNGVITAGKIMFREETGLWSPAKKADVTGEKMLAVLKEDVDTGGEIEGEATAEDAAAYRSGRFIDGAVAASDGAIDAAHKLALRQQGIVFGVKESTETFDNKKSSD